MLKAALVSGQLTSDVIDEVCQLGFFREDADYIHDFIHGYFALEATDPDWTIAQLLTAESANIIAGYAALFKDNSFKQENEVRIVHIPKPEYLVSVKEFPSFDLGFYDRNGTIKPYVILPLLRLNKDILSEIVIGPRSERDRQTSKKAVLLLLEENGYQGCNIRFSSIPYRSL